MNKIYVSLSEICQSGFQNLLGNMLNFKPTS